MIEHQKNMAGQVNAPHQIRLFCTFYVHKILSSIAHIFLSCHTIPVEHLLVNKVFTMKMDEEENDIIIKNDHKEEIFTGKEANDPETVQCRFGLEFKLYYVLSEKKELIPFGRLVDGKTYNLPKQPVLIEKLKVIKKEDPLEASFHEEKPSKMESFCLFFCCKLLLDHTLWT